MKLISLLIGLSSIAFSAPAPGLLQFYPTEVLRGEVVEFKAIAGHHFSREAPQSCGSAILVERGPRAVKCQFAASGKTSAKLNVCDDPETFCRPLEIQIHVGESSGVQTALTKNQAINVELHKKMVPGFVEGSPAELAKLAKVKVAPVFAMISTDWCPPCNEAKEFLLNTPEFQALTKSWFKIYIDGDSMAAGEWGKVIPFRYYPSFVMLNDEMQEVGRYTGDFNQVAFAAWAKEVTQALADPIKALKTRVEARRSGSFKQKLKDFFAGSSAQSIQSDEARLLQWALAQIDRKLIEYLLSGRKFPELETEIAHYQIEALEESVGDSRAAKIALRQQLLVATFKGEHWGSELAALCELSVPICQPYLAKIEERLKFLEGRRQYTESERARQIADELYALAEAASAAGDVATGRAFALKCAEQFLELGKQSILKISRAGQQGMVACLELARDFEREEKVLNQLVRVYPTEPTFLSRMARMLRKQKKYSDALRWISRAEDVAYGYNLFSLHAMKIEILLEMKKPAEAANTLRIALNQLSLDEGPGGRNERLLSKLRDLQAKVELSK